MVDGTRSQVIAELIRRVRARWRTLCAFQAIVRAALAAAAVLIAALILAQWIDRAAVLAAAGILALGSAIALMTWHLAPLRRVPSDARVARFIEEHAASLDDRLVTAVDVLTSERPAASSLAGPMLADAAARARAVDVDAILSPEALRRAGFQATASALVLLAVVFAGRGRARQAYDAAALVLFPEHVRLEVTPGSLRVKAGDPLAIGATLVGNRAPVLPQVEIGDGVTWRRADMTKEAAGGFRLAFEAVTTPFSYRVAAGPVTSPTYAISVAHPPRVSRIDVEYTFPAALGLKPRTEQDSGDIYAPAGSDVRLRIHTDRPAATGEMRLADGQTVALTADGPTRLSAALKIVDDNSYRVALADREGLSNPGDTEYFIRTLEDRPPEVHIVKPASDRAVARLDEVDVEAQADDDYGIDRMELVYSVRGGREKAVPFDIPRRAASVTGRRTLYLEDLDVEPGDFVSYYVRARDITRGKRSNEARSDIFFLEVKPFEQEFTLAQSQSMAGSGYNGSIDDLVNAQKQVVVATWKLDRRSRSARGAQSEQDVRSVARTEAELKSRVEQVSSSFRESTMRDPRRRRGGPDTLRAGQSMPEEDSMAAAAEAMSRAVTSLDALKTGDALPPELEALNDLLKAQAQVKERQVTRQQAGAGGPGNNNRNYDVSTLFDKELQRSQQTNYETSASSEQKEDPAASALDKIRDLARRQDELLRKQEELSRRKLDDADLKRELEKLTREQNELRRKAEDLASQQSTVDSRQSTDNSRKSTDKSRESTDRSQQSKGQSGGGSNADASRQMRDVSEEMRSAAGDLRRQDPAQASARGSRALQKLRDLERQMQAQTPEQRRRALGDMQLETRQLADAERQVGSELSKAQSGADTMRRLAGEQERLADRVRRLQDGLKQQPAGGDAARDLERQRLAERLQKSADEIRAGAQAVPGKPDGPRASGEKEKEMAGSLDKVADRLAAASGANESRDARRLSEQLSRAQQLRDRMDSVSREIEKLGRSNSEASPQKTPGETGRSGRGQSGGGLPGGSDLARLREEYARQLKQTEELLNEMRREDANVSRGGAGFTFEGQGMTLSAPGTEAFKQDFARWEEMRKAATTALDRAEATLSKKLQAQQAKDRLAAGVEDKAPAGYQKQVDSYFKALAKKKQ